MIPLFELYYDGVDPKLLNQLDNGIPRPPPNKYGHVSPDLSKSFAAFLPNKSGPSAQTVSMLSSLPSLIMGVSNFVSVPLANALGRRPALIGLSAVSFIALPWAAVSGSLPSHLAARCVQGLGTGASVSLVPLIIQDMTFIHERNKFMAFLWGVGVSYTSFRAFDPELRKEQPLKISAGRVHLRIRHRCVSNRRRLGLALVLLAGRCPQRPRSHPHLCFRSRNQVRQTSIGARG